jgi:nitrilase
MSEPFVAACVQNSAVAEPARNVAICRDLVLEAAGKGARLIGLPEYFSGVTLADGRFNPVAFPEDRHPVLEAFVELAAEKGIWRGRGARGEGPTPVRG